MTTTANTALYTGVTADLSRRYHQHLEQQSGSAFTTKYQCRKLVYYCTYGSIEEAIAEEKRIKGGSRKKKIALIEGLNPMWKDLGPELFGGG